MDILTLPEGSIGYDSQEVAAHVNTDFAEFLKKADVAAIFLEAAQERFRGTTCDLCKTKLGAWGVDPNHHGGTQDENGVFSHYCAKCCPDCNNGENGE